MASKFISTASRHRRRWPLVLAGVVLLAVGLGVIGYYAFVKKQDNFSNPTAAFDSKHQAPAPPKPKPETFKWPIYGYTPDRARYLDAGIHPPYRRIWSFMQQGGLVEFQPVLANGVLYYVNNGGWATALKAKTGRPIWSRKVGSLNASSPAWAKGRIYITMLSGAVISLDARSGRVIWRKKLPSRSESSPIVVRGVVYFGSEDGTVFAFRASDGHEIWTYHANGAVKAGLALSHGVLYFGDYAGEVTALRIRDGSRLWSTGTNGASFNRSGQFYSTPAVAYGRVYIGNTDSFVYSFVASSGQLAWRYATSNYVYSAPAVATVPRLGPTVFIGSYDGNFYALDARSGSVDWTHRDGGKISGAPTVVGKVVYYSNLGHHNTTGLDVRRGKPVWKFPRGAFNPVISDGKRVYLTGNSVVYGFVPKKRR